MSKSIDIFVDSQAPMEAFVGEMESLLGIKLQRFSESGEIWYEFRNLRIAFTAGEHDFENDRDMNFEDYRYHLSVRSLNIKTEEERKKWREDFARSVFEKLKAMRRYRLMWVEDMQTAVHRWHPDRAASRCSLPTCPPGAP